MNKAISGFSKLSKEEKIKWIANEYFSTPGCRCLLKNYWNSDENYSNYDEFIENTITNFYIPLGLPLIFSLTENTAPFPWKTQWLQLKAAKFWSLHLALFRSQY
jgi:hydroxymethylglutaryl-CoA reductase